jgi:hypothetical protein
MKSVWAGFKDVWQVVIIDSFRRGGESFFNAFDFGVLLGAMSILGVGFWIIFGIAKLVEWIL